LPVHNAFKPGDQHSTRQNILSIRLCNLPSLLCFLIVAFQHSLFATDSFSFSGG
jgi:hypothetical protein